MATRSRSNFFGDFLFCEKKVTATGVGSHPEGDQKKPQAEGSNNPQKSRIKNINQTKTKNQPTPKINTQKKKKPPNRQTMSD